MECTFKENGDCKILKIMDCSGSCKFRKTESELTESRESAANRLASLPYKVQALISKTQFNGKMPWNEVAIQPDEIYTRRNPR